jgi:hypothetical protein
METLGALIQQVGVVVFVGGFGLYLASIVYGMGRAFRLMKFQREVFLIGFYARAAGMVGIMGSIVGAVMAGAAPWISLLLVFIFGAPSLALLLVRPVRDEPFNIDLPKRGKS